MWAVSCDSVGLTKITVPNMLQQAGRVKALQDVSGRHSNSLLPLLYISL